MGSIFSGHSQNIDSTKITISSTDLSEDMEYSLTRDDELLLFIYEYSDSNKTLKEPLLAHRFNFNDNIKLDSVNWVHSTNGSIKYILFLIELDSEKTNFGIDPIVRLYFKELLNCFMNKDYFCIENYLGDEDLLGVRICSIRDQIRFEGRHKLDKYNYSITLE